MREDNYVGWTAFNAFSFAVLLVVLVFCDPLRVLANDRSGAIYLAVGLLIIGMLLGSARYNTGPGRIGAFGGCALLVLLGLAWLVFFKYTTSSPPQPSTGEPVDRPVNRAVEGGPGG